MDFVTGLPILTDWKRDNYNSILVIVVRLTKMVYYKPVKITINISRLAEVIIDLVVWQHALCHSIVTNKGSLFTWSSGHPFATSLASSVGSLPPSTCKLTVKPRGKIVLWKRTYKSLFILNKMTGPSSYQLLSLHIITPKMQALATRLSS